MLIKYDFEADWLEARKRDVTSTEVAALFGLSPYKSRLRLWHEKAGLVEDSFEESPFTIWGGRLQNAVGIGICEDEGWRGYDMTGVYIRDPAICSAASYDMKVKCDKRGIGHLEIKVAESFSEDFGWFEDKAPIMYECQMQAQMNEAKKNGTPFDFSCLGTLGRRQSTRLYFRQYDAEFGALIDEEVVKFWNSIKEDKPPPPDYAVDGELLQAIAKPVRAGETMNLSQDNRACEIVAQWAALSDEEAELNKQKKEIIAKKVALKAEMHDKIGNAETVVVGDYIVGAKEQFIDEKFVNGYTFRRMDVRRKKK